MVPVVDIGVFVEAARKAGGEGIISIVQNQPEVKNVARLVHDAICQYGFCYLANHGVPQQVLDDVYSSSKRFFELDKEVKVKYARTGTSFYGYFGLEKEKFNENRPHCDFKEAFNFRPCEEKDLPSEVPDLSQSFHTMFGKCHELAKGLCDFMGVALELEDPSLLRRCHQLCGKKGNCTTLRTLYYPPCAQLKEGQIQCSEHSDYGFISLLFQDDTGGLQIEGKDGEYHDVPPVPGTMLVNVGDMLQRWTVNRYPSTKHRVIISPQAVAEGRVRQSLVFFVQPDDDTIISCLDGSDTYPPITAYDFLNNRFSPTFN